VAPSYLGHHARLVEEMHVVVKGEAVGVAVTEEDHPFAFLLRSLRMKAGLTQEELAKTTTLTARTISALECGDTLKPQKVTIKQLADALGLEGRDRVQFESAARGHRLKMRTTTARAGGLPTATRTLPNDAESFTGREPELDQISGLAQKAILSGSVVAVAAIGGMAGIGKTTLAIRAGHMLSRVFPDGQVFLQLNGHSPGLSPTEPAEALESLLRLTDVIDIPDGLDLRAALWRKHTAGKRVLLVLDDAVSSAQVRPLLPGTAGCLVLVTSRLRLTALEVTEVINLGMLPPGEAGRLLVIVARRLGLRPDDASVQEIARLCGYLPLGIGLLAAKLRHDPFLGVATLASQLAAARNRPEFMHAENLSVSVAFDMSYRDLAPQQQRMFRLLGLLPASDVDIYAAAALGAVDLDIAQRNLEGLYDHYLIEKPSPDRYRFHDLIREHARTLAETDPIGERHASIMRLLDYYLHAARGADQYLARDATAGVPVAISVLPAYVPEMRTREDAVAWMESENSNLQAAADYAGTHGLHAHAIAIPAAISNYLREASRWREGIRLQLIALAAADDAGDQLATADALTQLGRFRNMLGDHSSAFRNLTKAVAISRKLGNQAGEARALNNLGALQHATGDLKAATRSFRGARKLFRVLSDKRGEARAQYLIGAIQYQGGKYATATANFEAALRLFRDQNDKLGQADAISLLAAIERETGRYVSAAARQTDALVIYREIGDLHEEAGALLFLGAMQYPMGEYQTAMSNLRLALDMFRALHAPFGEASALCEISVVQREQGDLTEAADSARLSLELYQGLESLIGEAEAVRNLGAVQILAEDYEDAAVSLDRALTLSRQLANPNGQAATLNHFGDLALASRNGDACLHYQEALEIATGISAVFEEARAREGIGRCFLEAGSAGKGIAWLIRAHKIYQRIGSPRAARVTERLARARGA
jgi:tetratricopeptide (TPR) repeat protein/transcriptional regulator with XRE-family HTH domain